VLIAELYMNGAKAKAEVDVSFAELCLKAALSKVLKVTGWQPIKPKDVEFIYHGSSDARTSSDVLVVISIFPLDDRSGTDQQARLLEHILRELLHKMVTITVVFKTDLTSWVEPGGGKNEAAEMLEELRQEVLDEWTKGADDPSAPTPIDF
jgi:hypothetical protein